MLQKNAADDCNLAAGSRGLSEVGALPAVNLAWVGRGWRNATESVDLIAALLVSRPARRRGRDDVMSVLRLKPSSSSASRHSLCLLCLLLLLLSALNPVFSSPLYLLPLVFLLIN